MEKIRDLLDSYHTKVRLRQDGPFFSRRGEGKRRRRFSPASGALLLVLLVDVA